MTARHPLTSLTERLRAGHSALLVIDMQNDFCAEGGYVARMGRDLTPCRAILPRLTELIGSARAFGVPVIWLKAEYEHSSVSSPMLAKQREMGIADVCCARGSWGAEFFGVAPEADERVIVKARYSGFAGTALEDTLREMGIETLVLAGVQTNVCVESTLRDAHSRGYYVALAGDCVASHMAAQHEATLANVGFLLGDVVQAEQIAELWAKQTEIAAQ